MEQTKVCICCKVPKRASLEFFYKAKRSTDGFEYLCKECAKLRAKEWKEANKERSQATNKAYASKPETIARLVRLQRENYPRKKHKKLARTAVKNAIDSGRLRVCPCEVCGSTESIEAHHDDYYQRLSVRWLCFKHHRELHGQKPLATGHQRTTRRAPTGSAPVLA